MKTLMLASVLALAACGGSKKGGDTTTTNTADPNTPTSSADPGTPPTPTGEGTPCTQEIAQVCPDGQIDACLKTPPEGDVHKCVAK